VLARVTDATFTVYVCSDGWYRTDAQVAALLAGGRWRLCLWNRSNDVGLVERGDGRLISVFPTDLDRVPDWIEIRSDGHVAWTADRRRTVPAVVADRTTRR